MSAEIAILVPVLNRPDRAADLAENVAANTEVSHELVFLCSRGDHAEIAACRKTGATVHVMTWLANRGDYARKINYGYTVTTAPYVLLGADDLFFHPRWDTNALTCANASGAGVIGTNDMANPEVKRGMFSTHPLVRRSYIEEYGTIDEPGQILCERYDHNFCDRELAETAMYRKQWHFCKVSRVQHIHPAFDRSKPGTPMKRARDSADSTYKKGLRNFVNDRNLWRDRQHLWGIYGKTPRRRFASAYRPHPRKKPAE